MVGKMYRMLFCMLGTFADWRVKKNRKVCLALALVSDSRKAGSIQVVDPQFGLLDILVLNGGCVTWAQHLP